MYKNLKSVKALILAAALLMSSFAFIGCGNDSGSAGDSEDNSEALTEQQQENIADTTESAGTPTEEDANALAKEFFDMESYDDGMNIHFVNPEEFKTITVEGENIPAGIGYDELLKMGWKPLAEDFAEEEPLSMIQLCTFTNAKGKNMVFGFAVDDRSKKVKDGFLCLYEIEPKTENPAEFLVDGVGAGSSIEDVVKAYGDKPMMVDTADYYIDGECLTLEYDIEGKPCVLKLAINPLTRKVVNITLQKSE